MAGLVPAIHVFVCFELKTRMPATSGDKRGHDDSIKLCAGSWASNTQRDARQIQKDRKDLCSRTRPALLQRYHTFAPT